MPTPYRGPVEVDIPLQIYGPKAGSVLGYVTIADIDVDDWSTEFTSTGPVDGVYSGAATVRLLGEDFDNLAAPATLSGLASPFRLRGQGRFLPKV